MMIDSVVMSRVNNPVCLLFVNLKQVGVCTCVMYWPVFFSIETHVLSLLQQLIITI